jgi:hypothetical protein
MGAFRCPLFFCSTLNFATPKFRQSTALRSTPTSYLAATVCRNFSALTLDYPPKFERAIILPWTWDIESASLARNSVG